MKEVLREYFNIKFNYDTNIFIKIVMFNKILEFLIDMKVGFSNKSIKIFRNSNYKVVGDILY